MVTGARYVQLDARADFDADGLADEDTVIYNLAAVHRTPGHPSEAYFETNVGGAHQIARFAARRGVRRVVFTSSIAVYGPREERMDETAAPLPASSYGWSKLLAEGVFQDWARADPGRRLVIVRPAVIFGPGEGGNFTRLAAALRRRAFAYPGRRDTIKGCAYVKDLIESMEFALALDRPEFLYNLAYPEPYTIEAICEAFHRVGNLPRPFGSLPAGVLNLAARPFEGLELLGLNLGVNRARIAKLTRSTHVAPQELMNLGYEFRRDLAAALDDWRREAGAFQ
jgi:nucleoside-diphosphate-sugar epimerase